MALSKRAEYRFLIVGKSGSGKSSTANTLMGHEDFQAGFGLASSTKMCSWRTRELKKPKVTFQIMDTPGLFDPNVSNEKIRELIIKSLSCVFPGLHALFMVMKMDRFTPEEYNTFQYLKSLFGAEILKYTIIIFTRKDEMVKRRMTLESLLAEADEPFKEVLKECGGRVMAFDNMAKKKREEQVCELLEMVHKLLKDNGDKPYHCDVQDIVNNIVEKEIAEQTDKRIEQDPKLITFFGNLREDLEQKRNSAEEHKEKLTVTMTKEEMMMMQLKEVKKQQQETQEALEKMKQDAEMRKKVEQEEREQADEEDRRKREKEEKAEQKRQQEEERKKRKDLEKELAKLQAERAVQEELAKQKEKLREEAEKNLAEEKKKIEEEVTTKVKEDIASGKDQHWVKKVFDGAGDVASGAWKAVSAWWWG